MSNSKVANKNEIYTFYHGECPDGEISNNILTRCLPDQKNKEHVKFLFPINTWLIPTFVSFPWKHHNKEEGIKQFMEIPEGGTVIFLDICPAPSLLGERPDLKVLVIDHHKAAVDGLLEKLDTLPHVTLISDTKKAGCYLTWEFCYPDLPYPPQVEYIGAKDIWNFENPNTEPFCAGYPIILNNLDLPKQISLVHYWTETQVKAAIAAGKTAIAGMQVKAAEQFSEYSADELVDENNKKFRVLTLNCADYGIYKYILEHAKEHYNDYEILRIVQEKDNKCCYSLRAIKEDVTVDSVARKYGGNGHPKAAGYAVDI